MTRPRPKRIRLPLTALAAVLLTPWLCPGGDGASVWREPELVRRGENEYELSVPARDVMARTTERDESIPEETEEPLAPAPEWIGDCCYYPDGSYYHQDGVYWLADLKTHYVYAERCWHLANGGILTDTGVYFPPITAPAGLLGLPLRLAAVMTALAGGPPWDPGAPPEEPVREDEVTEARSSSDR